MAENALIIDSEEWRPVTGWVGVYEVSNLGRVRSLARTRKRVTGDVECFITHKSKVLSAPLKNGYPFVCLRDCDRIAGHYVHALVCEAFHGPRPVGCDVAHTDGTRTNNAPSNLRWASRLQNMRDKSLHGTERERDTYQHAKIKNSDLPDIDRRLRSGETQRSIAESYGIARSYVSQLKGQFGLGGRHGN